MARRALGTMVVAAVLVALVLLYIFVFLVAAPKTVSAAVRGGIAHLTLQTMASYGHPPDPDWVSYEAQDSSGHWHHTTIVQVPAHTLLRVTIYQFDTATGLRNPFLAQIRGTQGGVATINCSACSPPIHGPVSVINPSDASHTFTVPDLGLSVPLAGVSSMAKNLCTAGPCTPDEAHTTTTFSFMTPGPGKYRWQCFVPCAVGFYFGNGGPMQTIGWMSGTLVVV